MTLGWIDEPAAEGIVGPRVRITGWALDTLGVASVEIRHAGVRHAAQFGLARHDVAVVHPGYPDSRFGGFEFEGPLGRGDAHSRASRSRLHVVAIARDGRETLLGRRSVIAPESLQTWRDFHERNAGDERNGNAFFLLPALSGVAARSAEGLDARYAPYLSPTTRIGMRVPILYLRTTRGAAGDWAFDPDFDVARTHGARAVAEDSLTALLADAVARGLPVLVTLDGGIWADASGTVPEWDINDRLEEDIANCQWNERDEVMPDDWLKHLPGSRAAPELSRALTFNVYATTVRRYKRRNLQQAAAGIVAFMRGHPDLFVGVNLDPDVYINPFFSEGQWYDYNPGTLRQFRHWLAGTGPYAGATLPELPDLSSWRRARLLSLEGAAALARRPFATWDDVDAPRSFPRDPAAPYWKDPWVHEWEMFRRHLVTLHYDELAQWLIDAGVPRDRIWSSQGLMAPWEGYMSLALRESSPVRDYDSGGVSIEGSKPRNAHLGAIVYGPAATNEMPMENGRSLYATLADIDPGFGIVEFNTADLRKPRSHPTYADAYRALRDLWNAGARFVSPMAWNGSNGLARDDPDYAPHTGWRNTPLEDAALDFLLARAGLPLGSLLWTFGGGHYADDDGWTATAGSIGCRRRRAHARAGRQQRGGARITGRPPDRSAADDHGRRGIAGRRRRRRNTRADVHRGRPAWMVAAAASGMSLARCSAGIAIALARVASGERAHRLRIEFGFPTGAAWRCRGSPRSAVAQAERMGSEL